MTELSDAKRFSARIVLHPDNSGWILEKFAIRLAENLPNWNVVADIDGQPSSSADINHWMLFLHCQGDRYPRSTALVTHFTRPTELWQLRSCLRVVDVGICLSRATIEQLVQRGVRREKLCYVTPAHDGLVTPRRVVIGITSRVYADGRKREDLLLRLAERIRLDAFHFLIIGKGWEAIIPHLMDAGATVDYHTGSEDYSLDYEQTLRLIPTFDYYLYLGFDEGSMGFLDALAAGVPTIVTPQGFHLDVKGGITHAFETASELANIFAEISRERDAYITSVKELTWNEYARKHALIWRKILKGESSELVAESDAESRMLPPLPKQTAFRRILADSQFYGRPVLNRIKRLLDRK